MAEVKKNNKEIFDKTFELIEIKIEELGVVFKSDIENLLDEVAVILHRFNLPEDLKNAYVTLKKALEETIAAVNQEQ